MKRIFRRVNLVAVTAAVLFASTVHASTQSYTGNVLLVYPMSDGSFAIGFTASLSGCSTSGTTVYTYVTPSQNAVTVDGAKSMLATVLTAFIAGRQISITYDNATVYCYINRLLVQ